jgi:hypothetical protein
LKQVRIHAQAYAVSVTGNSRENLLESCLYLNETIKQFFGFPFSEMMFNPDTLLSRTFSDSSLQTLFPHLLFLFPEFILHDGCNFSAIFVICQELLLKFCYNFEKP